MYFNEDEHKYIHKVTGEQYISCTTLISKYKNKFHTELIAQKCYEKGLIDPNYKYAGMSKDEIKNEWEKINKEALRKGNKWHFKNEIETLWNETNLPRDYNDYIFDLSKLEDGVYPELRLWLDKYKLAGTADKVIIEKPFVDIYDHKTNKRVLSKVGFDDQMMLEPLDYLPDSDYYHYELQLNIYAWILSQYGFKPRYIEIFHKRFLDDEPIPEEEKLPFINDDKLRTVKTYKFKYYPIRVETFLDYDIQQRKNRQKRDLFGNS
jgi:hypothetical protein